MDRYLWSLTLPARANYGLKKLRCFGDLVSQKFGERLVFLLGN